MIYVDTSVLVSALTLEVETTASQAWLQAQKTADLAISDWTIAEFSSALSIKVRTGALSVDLRSTALTEFESMTARSFLMWEIERPVYARAARLCERVETGLRASDALHLAIAEAHGAVIATLDRGLAAAAEAAGVSVLRVV